MEFRPMSPDEIERTLQFLLSQQAQFSADLAKLSGKTDLIADGLIGLTGIVGRVAEAQERTNQRLEETNERLGRRLDELGQYIRTVESHLNVLIETFEAHLRDDHGQKPS